ncbi:MAG TPA: nucleotide sugar dehydrogenase [Candidatus Acidoferrum sp.]|nr:nucleotide sugar dehydrogenase [Candidatus Acidoferrum sp.]
MVKSISVIGLGKLGAPMAAGFAARGLRVKAVDLSPQKVDAINRGVPPVHEPGLAELIKEAGSLLTATQNIGEAVQDAEATFIVVGTPSDDSGGFSLQYVLPTCEAIGRALASKKSFHLVVLTSTVMPGSTGGPVVAALERASGKRCGKDFGLCYNPEFIALGTVIRDFYNPDFLLIGESDPRAGDLLSGIYKQVCKNSPAIARMNFINAEITKLAVNTYITTKISYANMLARLCEKLPESDVNVVTDALGLDTRIGAKYLKGAVSYGGPCFPRDNRALAALASRVGASSGLAEATDIFNRAQIKSVAEIVKSHNSGSQSIGILGLTYKPNTDVVEESFGLLLAQELSTSNLSVIVYDPSGDATRALSAHKNIRVSPSALECISGSGVVVLATPWQAFLEIPITQWSSGAKPRVVVDCWRALGHLDGAAGVHYVKLGFGSPRAASRSGTKEKPVVNTSAAD